MVRSRESLASSVRSRVPVLFAAVLLGACPSSPEEAGAGRALDAEGVQSSGVVGSDHAEVGETWWFALPVPHNTSSEPIEITDVSLLHVPAGVKVLEYGAYDLDDTEGLPLLAREGEAETPDFARLENHADEPVKVAAGERSDIFYTVKLKVVAPPRGNARRCRFDYRQNGRSSSQELDCEVSLRVGPPQGT
ncbi:hypothetical protein [Streptomyces chilikensis]|uniref:Lipoprotein n=1 Tax=Streptomyces chilikensis TaxID=1194079 RepID=A0ABV3EQF1_9ACTN